MSWEVIRNVKPTPPKAAKVPPMGVSVAARKMGARSGKVVRYIKLGIGVKLAKELCLIGEQTGLRLSLGGGQVRGQGRAERRSGRRLLPRHQGQGWRLCADHQRKQRRRSVCAGISAFCGGGDTAAARAGQAAHGLLCRHGRDAGRNVGRGRLSA